MKGVVFNLLENMVEAQLGAEAWDALLDAADSDGIFVATETYPDEELLSLVAAASEATGIPAQDLVRSFGEFMLPEFAKRYPVFFEPHNNVRDFLLSVDQVIHVEVRKLYPEAGLPTFEYEEDNPDTLTMLYRSPRKLCALSEGLITGAAKYFKQPVTITHDICMHKGSDHCELKLDFRA